MESIFIFIAAIIISLTVTEFTRRLALQNKIGSYPDSRRIHIGFIPSMGGLGIFMGALAGIVVSLLWKQYYWEMFTIKYLGIALGSLVMLITGIYDDFRGLKPIQKFIMQIIATTIVISFGCKVDVLVNPFGTPLSLGWFSIPVTYFWLLWVTNAINLLDGLDGLAAGVSLIVLGAFAYLAFIQEGWMTFAVCLALIGGILGFLKFNYHPAKIFMGDTGSLFLGFVIASVALEGLQKSAGNVSLLIPIVALAVPLGDSALAFFRRLYSGHHPFHPDKDHLHHRLIALGLEHKQAVQTILLATLLFALASILMSFEASEYGIILLVLVIITAVFSLFRLGYLEAQRSKAYLGDEQLIPVRRAIVPLSLSRFWHKFFLVLSDLLAINISFFVTYWLRFYSGIFDLAYSVPPNLYFSTIAAIMLSLFFLFLFAMNGLYSIRWDLSRFDIVAKDTKVILFGAVIIFIVTFEPDRFLSMSRLNLLFFSIAMIFFVNLFRMILILIEKKLVIFEYTPHNTILVGTSEKARKILKDIRLNPHLLYEIRGVVTKEKKGPTFSDLPNLGSYEDLPQLIRQYKIEEVIIAINEKSRDEILNIVAYGENMGVIFKVIPQMYDLISGHKTEEVIGHPLIRLFPDQMLPWQWVMKRTMDILVALGGIILLSPVFLLTILMQIYGGIFPFFVIEDKVGKQGKIFGQLLFNTGKRQSKTEQFIFSSNVYKLPQVINLLLGSLSLVGPRPERRSDITELRDKIKFYNRRFLVRPGITGWAQVKYRYSESLKQRKEQFKHDIFYLENMSLIFDLRIILRSLFIFFFRK